jgi:hypothetical protein
MQKGRIDYVPPQPDVLKGALSHDVQPALTLGAMAWRMKAPDDVLD